MRIIIDTIEEAENILQFCLVGTIEHPSVCTTHLVSGAYDLSKGTHFEVVKEDGKCRIHQKELDHEDNRE